jgi:hypothetical protein
MHSRNYFSCGKATNITYSGCVSAVLVIQQAKRVLRIILWSVACLALPHPFRISHKPHDFCQKLMNIKYLLWFSLHLSETFINLCRTERDIIKSVNWSSRKYLLFLSDINGTWIFFVRFSKNTQITNFMKFLSVGAELSVADGRTEGQTDATKLIVALGNIANAPGKEMWM